MFYFFELYNLSKYVACFSLNNSNISAIYGTAEWPVYFTIECFLPTLETGWKNYEYIIRLTCLLPFQLTDEQICF